MSVKLALLGWSSSNLRCPDHEVNLCQANSNKPYPVTLMQMPNGTGKTTTLNMLRTTLSGVAQNWNKRKICELQRTASWAKPGKFVVKLAINDNPLTFELTLDFIEGKASYRTTYGSGIQNGFSPPLNIRKFLNSTFVNLFVFDGELANNLLNPQQTRAREAIDSLFQLSLLEELAKVFQSNWERHAELASSKTAKGLSLRKNKLAGFKNKKDSIQKEQKELRSQKFYLKTEVQKTQIYYDEALSKDQNIGSQLQEIKKQLQSATKEVGSDVQHVIVKMRDPQRLIPGLAVSLVNLKANLDRLKLPQSTSKEFFEELAEAEAEECVCGRTMDNETRQAVRARSKNYLGEDEVGVLNSIKSDIANYCDQESESYSQELQEQLQDLGASIRKRDDLKTQLRSLEEERLKQGDSELEEKKNRLEKLREQLDTCTKRLQEIERSPHSKPSEDTDCLKELDQLIKKGEDDVAEATNTLTLKDKTDIARKVLFQAHKQAGEELRKFIVEETNHRITQLLSRDPVLLEDIQNSLILQGRGGASMGQTLSVSYAFLATLFNRSAHQLPFIVDSPAGALDLNVRPEVARLIPSLCNQFVAFTISSERQSFVDVLHQAAKEHVQYLTLFRKSSRMTTLCQNVTLGQSTETVDGVMVTGKDFFDRFDLDEEG